MSIKQYAKPFETIVDPDGVFMLALFEEYKDEDQYYSYTICEHHKFIILTSVNQHPIEWSCWRISLVP